MNENKDNTIDVEAVLTDVHPTNKGVTKITLEVDTAMLDGHIGELANLINSKVTLAITPNQTELDTDERREADGQTEMELDK